MEGLVDGLVGSLDGESSFCRGSFCIARDWGETGGSSAVLLRFEMDWC